MEVAEMQLMLAAAGSATVVSVAWTEPVVPTQVMIIPSEVLNTGTITYSISRDNGITWTVCPGSTVVDISAQPSGTQVRWKAVLTNDSKLSAIAISI